MNAGRRKLVVGRKPALARWQISYARHARQLRRAMRRRIGAELCDDALAVRFGVSPSTLNNALAGIYTAHHNQEPQ